MQGWGGAPVRPATGAGARSAPDSDGAFAQAGLVLVVPARALAAAPSCFYSSGCGALIHTWARAGDATRPPQAKRPKVADEDQPLALLSLLAGAGVGAAIAASEPPAIGRGSPASAGDLRPHKCPVHGCNYSAKGTGHLKRHIRTHTGEKPFKCPWDHCSYASNQSTHLTAHMRKHTGERPFNCPVAGCSKYLFVPACACV